MKAISLWQPWASALFTVLKKYETRHWALPKALIGQTVAIHAAKHWSGAEIQFWRDTVSDGIPACPRAREELGTIGIHGSGSLPFGCVIGTLRFVACHDTNIWAPEEDGMQMHWGNFSEDRFAWERAEPKLFPKPIPCIGRQGFFDWCEDLIPLATV